MITRDVLRIRDYGDDQAIKTPNAVWARLNGQYQEYFNFNDLILHPSRENRDDAYYTQPFLSFDKTHLLFEFNDKIYKIKLIRQASRQQTVG
ncbi:MAG: hypothetical protein U5R06_14245 [candidate division KSB1 bacterium]|nr:hypothetical protein [candidate division KSB1 bacterium]